MASVNTLKRYAIELLLAFFYTLHFFALNPADADTVAMKDNKTEQKAPPPLLAYDDIWFYDRGMTKQIPAIDTDWVAAVLQPFSILVDSQGAGKETSTVLLTIMRTIVKSHDDIIDSFYDRNHAKNTCFFRLRKDLTRQELQNLIVRLNQSEYVSYVHPTIKMKAKTYAFFNSFDMEWKTGVDEGYKKRVLSQVHVKAVPGKSYYRVDVFRFSFFKAVNLLAEDIHTLWATPQLTEVTTSVEAEIRLPIHGGDVGDKIPFSLNIRHADYIQIDPSSIANLSLRPRGIQKELFDLEFDAYDYLITVGSNPIQITGWMKFYAPGEYVLPPIRINYTYANHPDNSIRSIETRVIRFKVSSIVSDKQLGKKLIVPLDNLTVEDKSDFFHKKATTHLLFGVACLFIALLSAIWFVVKLLTIKKEKEKLQQKEQQMIIFEKLTSFLKEIPTEPHWVYLAEAGKLLRACLVEVYSITDAPTGGSGEVFFQAIQHHLPADRSGRFHDVFKHIDECIAQELDCYPDFESLRKSVLHLLESICA